MGYSFYYPPENKVLVARNAKFLENSLITQEASGSLEDLEIIQEEDTHPFIDTSLNQEKDDLEIDEPQSDIIPICRSTRTRRPTDHMCLYIDAEEHELGDLDNEVWDLVELPPNDKTVGSKWLFKKKIDMNGAVHTYKARIRAIRILIAITAYYDYEILQMDVKTAFLNRYLSEEVYMEQPEGFVNPKYPNRKFGFTQNRDEPCVYLKASGSNVTFLILYVDDILIMGNNIPMLQDVKSYLGRCFAMKDLGEAAYILGIKIYRDRSQQLIGLCQSAYIEKILKQYHMENSKRGSILMQEKLLRRDLHLTTIKNILKYLRNTKDMFLVYESDIKRELKVSCYTDAGYLIDVDDLKSQTGYVFVLNGGVVDWKSAKKFISGLGIVPTIKEPINMYCDNTGAITIANKSGITKGARHFCAKVHYLRKVIEFGDIKLEKVHTYDNLVDPLLKPWLFQCIQNIL
ncbi:retrotransposon protein, putative, ty1-copia subclass [Tanacetum coccineum]